VDMGRYTCKVNSIPSFYNVEILTKFLLYYSVINKHIIKCVVLALVQFSFCSPLYYHGKIKAFTLCYTYYILM
jgi:hypothetical protein